MKKNILRLLSLFLGLFIIVLVPLLFFRTKAMDEEYYKTLFNDKGAEQEIYNSVDKSIKLSCVNNGVSIRKYKFEIDKEMIYKDFLNNFDHLFNYLKGNTNNMPQINVDKYSVEFDNKLANSIGTSDLNSANSTNITNMKNDIMQNISNNIDVLGINKYATSGGLLSKVQSIVKLLNNKLLLYSVVFAMVFDVILMLCVDRRKTVKYISTSMIMSSLIMGVISFSGYLSKMYYNSPIGMKFLQESVGDIIKSFFVSMTIISCIILFIGIVMLTLNNILKNKSNVCD